MPRAQKRANKKRPVRKTRRTYPRRIKYGLGNPLNALYYIPGVGHVMDASYEGYKKVRGLDSSARAGFQQGGTWGEHRRVNNYVRQGHVDRAASSLLPGLGYASGYINAGLRGTFHSRNAVEKRLAEEALARDAARQLTRGYVD